ncbi:ECF transporter S component [Rossellomorea sp. NS-SX7]|uniref:ECF transporter S component n=1 Tax=Rossellomorea sp. NS-SX7 TaxID=3463856 RepID=UPI0040583959
MKRTNKLTLLALLVSLSAAGGLIKIPAVVGSVALDSLAALLAASIIGGGFGAVTAMSGHLISALLAGFPLGPLHVLIAAEMAGAVWLFGVMFKQSPVIAAVLFFTINAFIAPLPFIFIISKEFYFTILPSLCIGSFLNLTIAHFAYPPLNRYFHERVRRQS